MLLAWLLHAQNEELAVAVVDTSWAHPNQILVSPDRASAVLELLTKSSEPSTYRLKSIYIDSRGSPSHEVGVVLDSQVSKLLN